MKTIARWLERLSGALPIEVKTTRGAIALGVWWCALLLATLLFIGRATKFIYVDF